VVLLWLPPGVASPENSWFHSFHFQVKEKRRIMQFFPLHSPHSFILSLEERAKENLRVQICENLEEKARENLEE